MRNNPNPKNSSRAASSALAAFTFVELVVAMAIGAGVIMAAVLAFGAIARTTPARKQTGVQIGFPNMVTFYNLSGSTIAVSEAPSFSAAAMANNMRDQLLKDVSFASAVCCLPRNKANTIRPTNLVVPASLDPRGLVSPEQFRTLLIDTNSSVYTNFNPTNAVNGATTATNLTIYVLSAVDSATNITVTAIYESDYLTVTNSPSGVYASVRRYVGSSMTDYYHVFYPGQTNNAFTRPVAAFFTQSGTAGGDSRFRQAARRPFYMAWWPDPLRKNLASTYPSESTVSSNARADYMLQSGATSYFFVIPAFPPL